jgi:hypothetical protein
MGSLLLVLAFTCVLLVPVPAWAQTSQAGASDDQYDDNVMGDGTADGAVQAALLASGALQTPSEVARATGEGSDPAAASSNVPSERDAAFAEEGDAVSSAEAQGEAQGESASMAAVQGESANESANTSGLEKLPQTGGPSPLWLFGAPLICIGGILARRIVLA